MLLINNKLVVNYYLINSMGLEDQGRWSWGSWPLFPEQGDLFIIFSSLFKYFKTT